MTNPKKRVAVVGGGVAGIVSAYLLAQKTEVTLFEANTFLGGHTNTVTIPAGKDQGTPVDTGFIVLNDQTYPLFHRFLSQLHLPVRYSEMSFSFYSPENHFYYAGTNLNGLFAQRLNLLRPGFYSFLKEIYRFCSSSLELLKGEVAEITLGEYIRTEGYSRPMVERYLAPMAASIWSSPAEEVLEFPLETFLRFFKNHGLLQLTNRPRWQTVVGGSSSYVRRFQEIFKGEIRLSSPISSIARYTDKVVLNTPKGAEEFDELVIATHADVAYRLLSDPSTDESKALSPWRYNRNHTVLHTDVRFLPPVRRAWASWNYLNSRFDELCVTYYMNRLQGLNCHNDYCVTLNPTVEISGTRIVKEIEYHHPVYTREAIKAQPLFPQLNGKRRTYYCGSYHGYGFHEDAVKSANEVAKHFGVEL